MIKNFKKFEAFINYLHNLLILIKKFNVVISKFNFIY